MATRYNINDFALANPAYVGGTVSFWTVSGGAKTATLATLYAASTGSTTLTNPRTLDSDGKFSVPVYVEVPTIATVSGLTIADHDTGIMGLAEGAASASATAAAASEDAAAVSAQAALDSEVAAAASAASISLPLPVASGGTASTTAAAARTSLGVKLQGGKGGCISNMGGSNPFSQCHLVPRNGNTLLINGELQTIPAGVLSVSGGVQATYTSCYLNGTPGQSLAANTDYYIYAAMSGSTMILDFSATIPDVDSTYGIMVKTGDATRTLVGFLHTDASIKTLGSANAQTIISYYNRLRYRLETSIDGSTTAGAWEELNTANRLHWCQWSEDLPVGPSAYANWGSTVSDDRVAMGIGLASASPWSTPSSPNGYTGAAVINGTASGSTAITARAQNPGSAIGGYMWCNLLAFRQGGSGTCSIYGSAAMLLDNNAV